MKELHTDIEIAASPERVWRVLTDFASYPSWNPLVVAAQGALREGERLKVKLSLGKRAMPIKPVVLRVVPERELTWRGSAPLPGTFSGEHSFELQPIAGNRTRFHQWERFSGLLVPLLGRMIDGPTRRGFEAMNRALKQRAEA